MARVQSQQIIELLDQMRGLNGQTDSLLDIIQAQQANNVEAIRQMEGAADLIRRLMQGRQDMEDILNAVGRHGEDMDQNVERIREALNSQPTVQQMRTAIQELEETRNMALQAGLPAPPPGQPPAQPNSGLRGNAPPFQPRGGYNWRSSAKKSKPKTRRRRGGYNWRSSVKKTKTKTKTRSRSKKGRSSSRRSSKK